MGKIKVEDFAYIVDTEKGFDEAVVSVLKAVDNKGWALFQVYDIKERLAAKGFVHKPLKIIEICSAKHANAFLSRNILISLCMPCKINVFEENGRVKIAAMKPTVISQFFPEVTKIRQFIPALKCRAFFILGRIFGTINFALKGEALNIGEIYL